ncbi:MAG: ADP-ribosylglycohydrolase family protein [Deltaproteobacteria bacterium]|nr:ADP-ribosylglycohydrolase family protein [Myxococcales bacterium]MDP3212516.1 ADP-ribosylglycohydrolase family protein [Deltaproteobacteria bacterium]
MSATTSALPADHDARLARALRSLDGLSLGDAFGQRFFGHALTVESMIAHRAVPRSPWHYTDDTEMALALFGVLARRGRVEQDALAAAFAHRWRCDPTRGYAGTAMGILRELHHGGDWREVSAAVHGGTGSMGNGAAMRVAPLGAYFAADDAAVVAREATLSAEVTHMNPEGQAGAVAVALAAQYAWRLAHDPSFREAAGSLWAHVLAHTPDSETRATIELARDLPADAGLRLAASVLGTGYRVISQDTVPFTLWCAARSLDDFEEAMWLTVEGLGDRDTTCAIVGGIVALSCREDTLPTEWLVAREALAFEPELRPVPYEL